MRRCAFVRGAEGWQKAPRAVLCLFKRMDFGHTPNDPVGLLVQSEVSSGHLRQLDYASPTLSREEASCSCESGPEFGSRFTDSRWGGRGE